MVCLRRVVFVHALSMVLAATAFAHPGRGIVVSDEGDVFVADAVRSVVWQIRADGAIGAHARDVHAHWLEVKRGALDQLTWHPDGQALAAVVRKRNSSSPIH